MRYELHPYAKRLFQSEAFQKVHVAYRGRVLRLPKTDRRPPYFAHPRYEPHYPLI